MLKGGKPTRINHLDWDWHATFGSTEANTVIYPDSYNIDAGLTIPNQRVIDSNFSPSVPALPEGCTDEAQADLTTNLTKIIHTPLDIENITHANAKGGSDVRTALLAAKYLGWINAFFNIQSYQLDYFDSIRLAMVSGIPEERGVSIGTPWYEEWESPTNGIIIPPVDWSDMVSWHNWVICGWKTINGSPYLIGKTWQGKNYGDGGFMYIPRDIINAVMNISGSVAFTVTNSTLPPIQTIPVNIFQWLISNIKNLIGLQY